jgi:hypothetical protein
MTRVVVFSYVFYSSIKTKPLPSPLRSRIKRQPSCSIGLSKITTYCLSNCTHSRIKNGLPLERDITSTFQASHSFHICKIPIVHESYEALPFGREGTGGGSDSCSSSSSSSSSSCAARAAATFMLRRNNFRKKKEGGEQDIISIQRYVTFLRTHASASLP